MRARIVAQRLTVVTDVLSHKAIRRWDVRADRNSSVIARKLLRDVRVMLSRCSERVKKIRVQVAPVQREQYGMLGEAGEFL